MLRGKGHPQQVAEFGQASGGLLPVYQMDPITGHGEHLTTRLPLPGVIASAATKE
jgi:hypothetical protein